jgi:hypothetical protein
VPRKAGGRSIRNDRVFDRCQPGHLFPTPRGRRLPKFSLICLQCHTAIGYVIQAVHYRILDTNPFSGISISRLVSAKVGLLCSPGGRGVMKSIPFKRLARLGTGAFLLLWVHGFYAPSAAWAACNHLVTAQSDPFFNLTRLDALIVGDSVKSPLEQPVPARRMPCSGLACSSSTPSPASTISPEPNGSDQWGTLGVLVVFEVTSPPVTINDPTAPHSAAERTSIFHPPRV